MEFVRLQIVEYGIVLTDLTAVGHPATLVKISYGYRLRQDKPPKFFVRWHLVDFRSARKGAA